MARYLTHAANWGGDPRANRESRVRVPIYSYTLIATVEWYIISEPCDRWGCRMGEAEEVRLGVAPIDARSQSHGAPQRGGHWAVARLMCSHGGAASAVQQRWRGSNRCEETVRAQQTGSGTIRADVQSAGLSEQAAVGADWPAAQPPASMRTRVCSNHTWHVQWSYFGFKSLHRRPHLCPFGAGVLLEAPSSSIGRIATAIGAVRTPSPAHQCQRPVYSTHSAASLRHKARARSQQAVPVYGTKTVTFAIRGATSKPCVQKPSPAGRAQ
jgi:hypothetical protein